MRQMQVGLGLWQSSGGKSPFLANRATAGWGPGPQPWARPHLGCQDCAVVVQIGELSPEAKDGAPGVVAKLKRMKEDHHQWEWGR